MIDFNQSINATLHFERPEHICQFEWGYWPETIERWKREGMQSENPWEEVGITYYHRVPVNTRFSPPYEEKVISETESHQLVQDSYGIVKEISKNSTSIPKYISHPVSNMLDFEQLKERLNPNDAIRFPSDWASQSQQLKERNSILVMGGCEISFFGWHRDLMGVENLMMAFYEQPELIHAISEHHLWFLKELYSRILQDVCFDFIFVWEDMAYRNGPLISPDTMREFMLPYYKELTSFFREFGDYKFLLDSDGDITDIIPIFIEGGIDGLLPFEVAAGMDICKVAEQYPQLLICGGIDKREIAKGRQAIDEELGKKLPYMFKRGGYIPSLDHHVPPEVSYADFKYYIERVQEEYAKSLH